VPGIQGTILQPAGIPNRQGRLVVFDYNDGSDRRFDRYGILTIIAL
jgi:hypothetical protein